MPRRILIVSNFFPPHTIGGAEIVAFRQARALSSRGHDVTVLAGAQPSEEAPSGSLKFEPFEGIPVYRLALRSLSPDLNFYWASAGQRLWALITARNIGVVHFHNVVGLGANLIAVAKAAGCKSIVTLHDHWGFCFQQTRLRVDGSVCQNHEECFRCQDRIKPSGQVVLPMRMRRDYVAWCVSQADHLLVPSGYLAYAYAQAGFSSSRMSVLSNGIELSLLSSAPKTPSPDGTVRFLWSGYLGEHKGILVLLQALEMLAQDQSLSRRWKVTIAGEGHLRPKVEAEVGSPKLRESVRFVARLPRAELLGLLPSVDVSVLTSIWPENEPVTMLEAIASGTAQLATRVGGNVGLVEHLKSGFLITPNDPRELADTIRRYIAEPGLAAQHGARNLERRADFDETRTIDKLHAIVTSENTAEKTLSLAEPVIICGTVCPARQATVLMNQVHNHMPPNIFPRFIWKDWLEPAHWKEALLVWLWDQHPSEALVMEALRRGVPVLAPNTDWAIGLSRHYSGVTVYRTYLEALAALRVLLSIPTLRTELSWRAHRASAAAVALARAETFGLRSEVAVSEQDSQ